MFLSRRGRSVKIATVPKLPPLIDATADDKKLLGTVVDYYNRTLKAVAGGAAVSGQARPCNPRRSSTVSSWATPTARCACICRRRTAPPATRSGRG